MNIRRGQNKNNSRFRVSINSNNNKHDLIKKHLDTKSIEEFPSLCKAIMPQAIMPQAIMPQAIMPQAIMPRSSTWASLASTHKSNDSLNKTQYRDSKKEMTNERHAKELLERCKQQTEEFNKRKHLSSKGEYYSDSEDSIHEYVEQDEEEYSDHNDDFN
jgi:hypothetical protein